MKTQLSRCIRVSDPAPFARLILIAVGLIAGSQCALAQYTPTISGTNAFWFLGCGILADGGMCTPRETGPCYYAQSQLASNPNGAPGSPTWSVVQNGQGQVSLSCYTCANPVATALSPSGGCYSDIQIYVSYGGYSSAAFNVTINAPTLTYLQSPYYPMNSALYYLGYPGFQSTYQWSVVDACNYLVGGIDANEVLGTNYNDVSNNWGLAAPNGVYMSTYLINDVIATAGNTTPASEIPQTPLTTMAVHHDYPWALRVGPQTLGSGTPVRVDTQQWWLDHGTHQ